jgi:hypothetical protein
LRIGVQVCKVRLFDRSGVNREVPAPFCEGLTGQFRGSTFRLHWVLDISFGDDQSRIRKGNAPRNMAIVKKTVLNLRQITKKSMSRITFKRMRKLAGWNGDFLDTILAAKF